MPDELKTALVIMNIPTPYRVPLFNELARQLAGCGYRLRVVFGASGYSRRQWAIDTADFRFDYELLPSRTFVIGRSESASFTYPGLWALLARTRPAAVVVIGYSMATVKLWLRSLLRPTPYIIWSGTILSPFAPVGRLRTLQRRLLVSRAAAFVAYGSRAKDYLRGLGAPAGRVHIAINTVDTAFFARAVRESSPVAADAGFLHIGNLTRGKRIDLLLRAFARVVRERPDARLTLVGDGPEQPALEALCRELGIEGRVAFEGFRQRSEVPGYLARALCFVFPSEYDIWGLVLAEAMAAGLPCLASVHAGATADLVQDGVTGFVADFADTGQIVRRMLSLQDHADEARRMGAAASAFIQARASLAVSAAGMVSAVRAVVE